jgi:hypothetical protein
MQVANIRFFLYFLDAVLALVPCFFHAHLLIEYYLINLVLVHSIHTTNLLQHFPGFIVLFLHYEELRTLRQEPHNSSSHQAKTQTGEHDISPVRRHPVEVGTAEEVD